MTPVAVAYGTVYMDKGEDMTYAAAMIGRMSAQHPVAFYVDIICTQGQLEAAEVMIGDIRLMVKEFNQDIPENSKGFGITTDNQARPALAEMIANNRGIVVGVKDLNPNRKGHDER